MIAYFALGLSIFNTAIWVVVAIAIRRVFKKMLPLLISMGLKQPNSPTDYLTAEPISDRIGIRPELGDAETES